MAYLAELRVFFLLDPLLDFLAVFLSNALDLDVVRPRYLEVGENERTSERQNRQLRQFVRVERRPGLSPVIC